MSKIDYQKLREIAEKTKIAGEAPVMPFDQRINALNDFMKHFSPDIALASLEQNALSGNSRLIPGEVLSAIREVAKIRADFDDFDGDRRGIGDCLDEAEQELIVTINKYASQLAAEPIATNDVREQTAVPPVPEIQADVAQAIENLKQKLVECNRYNYCADAVKGVEDASRVLALQNQNMSAPITPEAIENAIEYIRSIAFHIDEDDYHGKHIAYFMRQALALLEGHSCSDDRQGKAENQPVRGNHAAESNRGNEWTGNPDIDNAIIMLDRIDTLENCDDDRIEAVKAVLRRLAGNSPVTPDGWVIVPKELTPEMMRAVQIRSELGGYATSNLSGAYNMFSEFWNVAVSAAPKVDDL
ncbi:hypothetical protein ACLHFP_004383 [Escherichia coli]